MPSIKIRERDLTSAGELSTTSNAVYIPGYAIMGPVNKPVLCNTVEQFQSIFGATPYVFQVNNQWQDLKGFDDFEGLSVNEGAFAEIGESEKSYVMAIELLTLGMPVLYERVFSISANDQVTSGSDVITVGKDNSVQFTNELKEEAFTATASISDSSEGGKGILKISASAPGVAGTLLQYAITETVYNIDSINSDTGAITQSPHSYYVITVQRVKSDKFGIGAIDPYTISFTFDKVLSTEVPSIPFYTDVVDEVGLITLAFSNCTISTTFASTESDGEIVFANLAYPDNVSWGVTSGGETPVTTNYTYSANGNNEFSVADMYYWLANSGVDATTQEYKGFYKVLDKGEYRIKFITTGAYPIFEYNSNLVARNFIQVAANRGDVTALVDHTPDNKRTLYAGSAKSVFYNVVNKFANVPLVNNLGENAFTYAAMYTPYGLYSCASVGKQLMLPASFGYLAAFATSVQNNGSWSAAAGVERGKIPNLVSLCQNVTNAIADSYQNRNSISINPITNIYPYGLTIWGNRTLKDNAIAGDLTATSFMNIRQLTSDVKSTTYIACKRFTFEQNTEVLWLRFKSMVTPILQRMQSGGGIEKFDILRKATSKRATVVAIIQITPIDAIEDWDITIELADGTATITE